MESLRAKVRDVPDFPKPGILFRDLTPVLADGPLLRETVEGLAAPFRKSGLTKVVGMEARGFIFGSLVAYVLGIGFVPLRKAGKLPYKTHRAEYALEYGEAALEMHIDALSPGDRVLLVDDLIATGGTAAASRDLILRAGATLVGCAFVVELDFLAGRRLLAPYPVHTLLHY
ncbi:MAG: adenine phosphoribosyltransferase [Gammaproteobacteria bacterium]